MTSAALKPNLQLLYVSDIQRSTVLYCQLLQAEPVFVSPRYVAFCAGGEALFALWSGGDKPDPQAPRYSEIGIMLPGGDAVDRVHEAWKIHPDIRIVQAPHTAVFGRTFVAADPDGHWIRVCPLD